MSTDSPSERDNASQNTGNRNREKHCFSSQCNNQNRNEFYFNYSYARNNKVICFGIAGAREYIKYTKFLKQ